MPTLNIADLALAIIWLFCALRGYVRGLVKEVGSLAAIALGFYCAGTYHKALAPRFSAYIAGNYADTAAYLVIFTVTLFGVWFVALAVSAIVKITMTQWADRFFGGAFGLAKGIIITAVILFLIHLVAPHPDFLKGSRLVPKLEGLSAAFVHYIPPDVNEKLRSWTKKSPIEAQWPTETTKPADKPAAAPEKKPAEPARAETDKKPAQPAQARGAGPAPRTSQGRARHHQGGHRPHRPAQGHRDRARRQPNRRRQGNSRAPQTGGRTCRRRGETP